MEQTQPFQRVHVVINPASGKDQPILNTLNDVFHQYDVEWDASITHKYGDARMQAKAAIDRGVDLVVGYGGDGTQHELANAVIGTQTPMAVLPGGTGNGFARELGIPKDLRAAVELICTGGRVRRIDAGRIGEQYFIQRMYAGVEPEQQTSRAMKDRLGLLAYAIQVPKQMRQSKNTHFRVTIDGQVIEEEGIKLYVVNSGMMGKGVRIAHDFSVDDGYLDVFVLGRDALSIMAAEQRLLKMEETRLSHLKCWRGKSIQVESEPAKTIWTDGELYGETPVTISVVPGILAVLAPAAK
jgi:YegS/Rv2252/BmrU family lipid kinase